MDITLVCLGDSLTYGYGVRRSLVWPTLVAKESGARILNRGVNGLLTDGMLASFSRDVISRKPDAVLLMGGANDIMSGLNPEYPLKNMIGMAKQAENADIVPLVGIPIPFCPPIREDWTETTDFPTLIPVYETYAASLRNLAMENTCVIVDFRNAMTEHIQKTGFAPQSLYLDGIHLNEDGHRLFAQTLVRVMHECLT